jgi:LysM repeat protein
MNTTLPKSTFSTTQNPSTSLCDPNQTGTPCSSLVSTITEAPSTIAMTPTIVWVTSETSSPAFVQFPGSSSTASSTRRPKIWNWVLFAVFCMVFSLVVADEKLEDLKTGSTSLSPSQQVSLSCFGLALNTIDGCFVSTAIEPQSTITSNVVVMESTCVSTDLTLVANLNVTGSPVWVATSVPPAGDFQHTVIVASAAYSNWESCMSSSSANSSAYSALASYFTATEEHSVFTLSVPITINTFLSTPFSPASFVPRQAPLTSRFTTTASQPAVTSRTSTNSGTRMRIPRVFFFFVHAARLIATVSSQFISTQSGNETVVIVPPSLYSEWRSCITVHNMSTKDCPLSLTLSLTTETVQPSTITSDVFITSTQTSIAVSSFTSTFTASNTPTPVLPSSTLQPSSASSTPITSFSTVTSPTAVSPTPKKSSGNRASAIPSILLFLVQFFKSILVVSANLITVYTDSAFFSQWQACITAHHNITSDCPLGLAWSRTEETITKSSDTSKTAFVTTSIVESIVAMSYTTAEPAALTLTSIVFATSTIGIENSIISTTALLSETTSSVALSTAPFIPPVPTSSTKTSYGTRTRPSATIRFALLFLAAYFVLTVVTDWMTVPWVEGIKSEYDDCISAYPNNSDPCTITPDYNIKVMNVSAIYSVTDTVVTQPSTSESSNSTLTSSSSLKGRTPSHTSSIIQTTSISPTSTSSSLEQTRLTSNTVPITTISSSSSFPDPSTSAPKSAAFKMRRSGLLKHFALFLLMIPAVLSQTNIPGISTTTQTGTILSCNYGSTGVAKSCSSVGLTTTTFQVIPTGITITPTNVTPYSSPSISPPTTSAKTSSTSQKRSSGFLELLACLLLIVPAVFSQATRPALSSTTQTVTLESCTRENGTAGKTCSSVGVTTMTFEAFSISTGMTVTPSGVTVFSTSRAAPSTAYSTPSVSLPTASSKTSAASRLKSSAILSLLVFIFWVMPAVLAQRTVSVIPEKISILSCTTKIESEGIKRTCSDLLVVTTTIPLFPASTAAANVTTVISTSVIVSNATYSSPSISPSISSSSSTSIPPSISPSRTSTKTGPAPKVNSPAFSPLLLFLLLIIPVVLAEASLPVIPSSSERQSLLSCINGAVGTTCYDVPSATAIESVFLTSLPPKISISTTLLSTPSPTFPGPSVTQQSTTAQPKTSSSSKVKSTNFMWLLLLVPMISPLAVAFTGPESVYLTSLPPPISAATAFSTSTLLVQTSLETSRPLPSFQTGPVPTTTTSLETSRSLSSSTLTYHISTTFADAPSSTLVSGSKSATAASSASKFKVSKWLYLLFALVFVPSASASFGFGSVFTVPSYTPSTPRLVASTLTTTPTLQSSLASRLKAPFVVGLLSHAFIGSSIASEIPSRIFFPVNARQACTPSYTVASGDTCYSIWTQFGLTQAQFTANNPSQDASCDIDVGQVVCVASGTAPSGKPTASTCTDIYTVQSGDSCYSIWTQFGLTEAQLTASNPSIDANCDVFVGQVLCVSGGSVSSMSAAPSSTPAVGKRQSTNSTSGVAPPCINSYTVQSNDTCDAIWTQFGMTQAQFLVANPTLDSNCDISVGQILCVSGPASSTLSGLPPAPTSSSLSSSTSSNTSACAQTYTVQSGDGCYLISQKYNITQAQLVAYNPSLDIACNITAGQVLCVSGIASASLAPFNSSTLSSSAYPVHTGLPGCIQNYRVKGNDTCYTIWTQFNITEALLLSYNPSLDSNCDISVGQVLCVSGGNGSLSSAPTSGGLPPQQSPPFPNLTSIANQNQTYFPVSFGPLTWSLVPTAAVITKRDLVTVHTTITTVTSTITVPSPTLAPRDAITISTSESVTESPAVTTNAPDSFPHSAYWSGKHSHLNTSWTASGYHYRNGSWSKGHHYNNSLWNANNETYNSSSPTAYSWNSSTHAHGHKHDHFHQNSSWSAGSHHYHNASWTGHAHEHYNLSASMATSKDSTSASLSTLGTNSFLQARSSSVSRSVTFSSPIPTLTKCGIFDFGCIETMISSAELAALTSIYTNLSLTFSPSSASGAFAPSSLSPPLSRRESLDTVATLMANPTTSLSAAAGFAENASSSSNGLPSGLSISPTQRETPSMPITTITTYSSQLDGLSSALDSLPSRLSNLPTDDTSLNLSTQAGTRGLAVISTTIATSLAVSLSSISGSFIASSPSPASSKCGIFDFNCEGSVALGLSSVATTTTDTSLTVSPSSVSGSLTVPSLGLSGSQSTIPSLQRSSTESSTQSQTSSSALVVGETIQTTGSAPTASSLSLSHPQSSTQPSTSSTVTTSSSTLPTSILSLTSTSTLPDTTITTTPPGSHSSNPSSATSGAVRTRSQSHAAKGIKSPVVLLCMCLAGSLAYKWGFWKEEGDKERNEHDEAKEEGKDVERTGEKGGAVAEAQKVDCEM